MVCYDHPDVTVTKVSAPIMAQSTSSPNQPFVPVVIPVYNDAQRLRETLEALRVQRYPADRYEVIVIDNGSEDESTEVARSFAEVKVLSETTYLSSPYSARNRGIEAKKTLGAIGTALLSHNHAAAFGNFPRGHFSMDPVEVRACRELCRIKRQRAL